MMPGRRSSDATDVAGGFAALLGFLLVAGLGWLGFIGFLASAWAWLLHLVRLWGPA